MTLKKDVLILYVLIGIEFGILFDSKIVIENIISTSKIFLFNIFPSIFPTMVIGNLLVKNNIEIIIPNTIKRLFNKLFGFTEYMTNIYIISMITGSPSNAIYINEYLQSNKIDIDQAQRLLNTTHFINPLFVVGGIGITIFNDIKIGILLLLMTWFSNFIKSFIIRKKTLYQEKSIDIYDNTFVNTLTEAIKTSINALLLIFGIIILFNILISLVSNIFHLNYIFNMIISALLEMTSGILKLKYLNISATTKFILSYLFLNFGGLCIHMQTFSMIKTKKIRYIKYLIFRII